MLVNFTWDVDFCTLNYDTVSAYLIVCSKYHIAGNFCGDFNLANWRIFFTKSPKLIPPNMQARLREYDAHNRVHNSAQWGHVQHTRIRQIKIRQ